MASTDSPAPDSDPVRATAARSDRVAFSSTVVTELGPSDLEDLLALSAASHWNQTRADWRWMLAAGRARGIRRNGHVLASTLVLPWPAAALDEPPKDERAPLSAPAWISMVLVRPDQRGQGFARHLLKESLNWLDSAAHAHRIPMLDATSAGRPIYLQAGFRDCWTFTRWQGHGAGAPTESAECGLIIEPITGLQGPLGDSSAQEAISRLDCAAFGADRQTLLSDLVRRAPSLALQVVRSQDARGSPEGFVLGRPGLNATQIGPIVARSAAAARTLFHAALERIEGPAFVDVPDDCTDMITTLVKAGFSAQRTFTRMLRGPSRAVPGDRTLTWAVAGPELG